MLWTTNFVENWGISFRFGYYTPRLTKPNQFQPDHTSPNLLLIDSLTRRYRVLHAKWNIKKRCSFSARNANSNLKIPLESSSNAIFSRLNKNFANHRLHSLFYQGWTQLKYKNHQILLCFPSPLNLHQAAISKWKELQTWD